MATALFLKSQGIDASCTYIHNFLAIFLIKVQLLAKTYMHHANFIEENSDQNLHIELCVLFRSWFD